jgi:dienelactone hydrolase
MSPLAGTTTEEVAYPSGDVTLAGTLILPTTPGRHPAVVIVHGSSPDTRAPLLGYASEVFAQHGIATLVYDKRGAGRSSGNLHTASLQNLADDARAGLRYLKSRPDIDPTRIGMEGESQGGWLIPLVAAQSQDLAFMVLVSASAVSPAQQEVFYTEQLLRSSGMSARVQDTGRKARKFLNDYLVAVQKGQLPAPEIFRQEVAINQEVTFDPVPVLKHVRQPLLLILGEHDIHVPAVHSAAIFDRVLKSNGNRDYTIIVYPGADHGIEVQTTNTGGAMVRAYAPGYHDNETNWVLAHVGLPAAPLQIPAGQPAFVESPAFADGGVYAAPDWYGSAAVQWSLIILFALIFLSGLLGLPLAALSARRTRRDGRPRQPARAALGRSLAVLTSLLNLVALAGTIIFLVAVLSSEETFRVDAVFNMLPLLGLLATIAAVALCWFALLAWRQGYWTLGGRIYYSCLAAAALVFVAFLAYWNMLGLQL